MVSLWPKSIHLPNFFSPTTFNSAAYQTLTVPNIAAIRYTSLKLEPITKYKATKLMKYSNKNSLKDIVIVIICCWQLK